MPLFFHRTSVFIACLVLVAVNGVGPVRADEDRPPNIVLVMCDDMGWSDVGCYGGEIRTPHIDRLAAEGVLFTQFYNNAKCTTTRASVMTGLYPRPRGPLLQEDMITVAELLRDAGYRTGLSGKWHLGSQAPRRPVDRGFDAFYGLMDGCCNFFDPAQPDPEFKGGRVRVFGQDDRLITEFPDDYYTTDAFTDHAVETIRRFAAEEKPFFVHVCYTAPHYPLHAPPEDIERYAKRYDDGWEALRAGRHARQLELDLVDEAWSLPPREKEVKPWADTPHLAWQARRMAVYAAMVDRMDQGIGRLLAALDETGTAENTIVLFLSDNGGCAELPGGEDPARIPGPKEFYTTCGPGWAWAQNTPFRRFKQWVHEGGISTPLVVRWPAVIEPGTRTNAVGHIIDLLPTLAEIAGAEIPTTRNDLPLLPVEGKSLLPVLRGESRPGHDQLFWEWAGNRAVREGDWKAVWDRRRKVWELYDVVRDRTETNDRAADDPSRTARLAQAWETWAKRTGHRIQ